MIVVIPNLVFRFVDPSYYGDIKGVNETYSDHVIADSWASFVEIILFTILAFFFRKYFTTEDALYVHAHAKQKTHDVRYSKLNVLNKVAEETDDDEVTDIEADCETVEMTNTQSNGDEVDVDNVIQENGARESRETKEEDKIQIVENKE